MQDKKDSALWKSLAVAFGDGLAFGVGMKLGHGSARTTPRESLDLGQLTDRLEDLENRIQMSGTAPAARGAGAPPRESLDYQVLEKVVGVLQARLAEHMGQVERRIAEMEAKVAFQLKALEARYTAHATAVQAGVQQLDARLKAELDSRDRRNAEIVDQTLATFEQSLPGKILSQVDASMQSVEERARTAVDAAATRTAHLLSENLEKELRDRMAPVEADLHRQSEAISAVQERCATSDRAMLNLVSGLGRLCEEAVRTLGVASPENRAEPPAPLELIDQPPQAGGDSVEPPSAPSPPDLHFCAGSSGAASNGDLHETAVAIETPEAGSGASPVPDPVLTLFSSREPKRPWRIPLVSSVSIATLGMVWLNFL